MMWKTVEALACVGLVEYNMKFGHMPPPVIDLRTARRLVAGFPLDRRAEFAECRPDRL